MYNESWTRNDVADYIIDVSHQHIRDAYSIQAESSFWEIDCDSYGAHHYILCIRRNAACRNISAQFKDIRFDCFLCNNDIAVTVIGMFHKLSYSSQFNNKVFDTTLSFLCILL